MQRFRRLSQEHRDRVFGLAHFILGRREDAEDVTQEVLLRLWEEHDGLDDPQVRPWLIRVTRNACVDYMRKQTGRGGARREYTSLDDLGEPVSPLPDPERTLEARRGQLALQREITQLSEPQRSIVILREIQHLSYAEISDALGITLSQVKVDLHRARRTLRERLHGRAATA